MNKFKFSKNTLMIVVFIAVWLGMTVWRESIKKQHKPPLPLASPSAIISPERPDFWDSFEKDLKVKRVKEADPVAYQNFKNSLPPKITVAEFMLSYGRLEGNMLKKGVSHAPASLLRPLWEKGASLKEVLLRHDPMLCYHWISGKMTPEDKVRYFNILQTDKTAIEIQKSFNLLSKQLLNYVHDASPVMPDEGKIAQQALKVESFIKSRFGDIPSIPELYASVSTNEQAAFACRIDIAAIRYMSDDKNGDFSDLIRSMLEVSPY